MSRGYARAREKDEQARAALEPLEPGERPTAVTVGAIVALIGAVSNLVALALGPDNAGPLILGTIISGVVAFGMWRARYWGVLGMQTILGFTIVGASLAVVFANSVLHAVIGIVIVAAAGALFWFLVKAMARIQMPERPGASRSR
jgi:hypothetical protein